MRKLSIEEIYYIEVRGRGTNLVLDSYVVESNSKISDYQKELLSCNFIRCHQGFLVNLSYIEGIKRYELTLKGGRKLPISKLRFDETRQRLFSYLSMKK